MTDSLERKFRLMTMLSFDKRLKRKHWAVYGFILDWYHRKYGNALASVRHIVTTLKERDPDGVGFFVGDVHSALTDLVVWGYLEQEKGTGRRASRYIPIWSKFDSVRETPNTSDIELAFGESQNTDVRETPNTTRDSVRETPNEDPVTVPGHKTGVRVSGNEEFEAAPLAPPADGLSATAAVTASGDGFKEFWQAWPRKHGKKKAEAEWKKITHDIDVIIDVARDWAAHYGKHGVDKKWIPEPANWLKGERWDEDLPLIHVDAKGAAIAKAKANAPAKPEPSNDNEPAGDGEADVPDFMKGSPRLWPVGRHEGELIDGEVEALGGGDVEVRVTFQRNDGETFQHRFFIESVVRSYEEEGKATLREIMRALAIATTGDTDELLFKPLAVVADGSTLTYSKIDEAA